MPEPTIADLHDRLSQLEAVVARWRIPGGGYSDPPPDGWGPPSWGPLPDPWRDIWGRLSGWRPPPSPSDPATMDISRLSKAQLQVTREMIKAERGRLDSLGQLVDKQIKDLG